MMKPRIRNTHTLSPSAIVGPLTGVLACSVTRILPMLSAVLCLLFAPGAFAANWYVDNASRHPGTAHPGRPRGKGSVISPGRLSSLEILSISQAEAVERRIPEGCVYMLQVLPAIQLRSGQELTQVTTEKSRS